MLSVLNFVVTLLAVFVGASAYRLTRGRLGLDQWPRPHGRFYDEWLRLEGKNVGDYYDWLAERKDNREPWRTWAAQDRSMNHPNSPVAVPICPLCGTPMEFRWERRVHDRTLRQLAWCCPLAALIAVGVENWSRTEIPTTDTLLLLVIVLVAAFMLGSKPVVRCDGCAYTVDAS